MIVEKLEQKYFETFCNDPLVARISIDLKFLQPQSKNRKKSRDVRSAFPDFILHYESHRHFQIANVNRFENVEAQSKK